MTDYIIPNNDNMNSEVWGSSLDAEGFFSTDPLMDLGSDLLDDDLFQASEIHEPAGSKARDDGQPSLAGCVHDVGISPRDDDWDYVVEVWPGVGNGDDDAEGLKSVADHIYEVNAAFEKKNLDYHLSVQSPLDPHDFGFWGWCRCYVLPRQYRNSERSRLKFLQVFSSDRQYNKALNGYRYKMSVVYGTRNPLPTGPYSSPMDEEDDGQRPEGFNPLNPNGDPTLIASSSPTPSTSSLAPTTPDIRASSPFKETRTGAIKSSHARMKPIPKPQRQAVKNRDGKFICTWSDCSANVKEFSRKCEWSKHMDKHERPYKCQAVGCENIPGFTYSGGLLRHEREVHRKHGGPKNPLYCPHKNCKRHKDSSFARLENLNEHLRRCHTSNGMEQPAPSEEPDLELDPPAQPVQTESTPLPVMHSPKIGAKRKNDEHDLREENKRLRFENQELRRKIEAGYLQQGAMMEQIDLLEKEKATLLNQLEDPNPIP